MRLATSLGGQRRVADSQARSLYLLHQLPSMCIMEQSQAVQAGGRYTWKDSCLERARRP